MHTLLHTILNRIATGRLPLLNAAEAVTLALLPEQDNLDILAAASAARAAFGPDAGASCGIVNAKSGHCPENCAFCAQSAHHRGNAPVYPLMSEDELLRRAEELARAGVSRFGIVTSGTALDERELDSLCAAAERILRNVDIRLCGSLGMLTEERGRRLKEAGFPRYHHNLETAASHFDTICSTHDYEEDILSLRAARRAGLEVCSCGIFGLGESWEQRVELGLTLAADSSFSGEYHDSDMGDGGDDYPDGTVYLCNFSGKFTDIKQLDDHSYSLTLEELSSDYEQGKEWVEDGVRYVSSEPYGVEQGKDFILYLPDTPTDGLNEEFLSWWPGQYQEDQSDTLDFYGLYNVDMGYGFFG